MNKTYEELLQEKHAYPIGDGPFQTRVLPKDGEHHECELLKYQDLYLEFRVADREVDYPEQNVLPEVRWFHSHWRLMKIARETIVVAEYILFCPCCQKDFRKDTISCVVGKPQLKDLLIQAGCVEKHKYELETQ